MTTNEQADAAARKMMDAFRALSGSQKVVLQKRLGATAVAEAEKGVRLGRDPYGRAWKPLTSRTGKPLRRTGTNIQRSWHARETGPLTFTFGSRFKWLKTHQYGAVIKPRRYPRLRFQVEVGWRLNRRGKAVRGAKGAITAVVFARSVTIPRRQLIPEMDTGGLGDIWGKAFERTTGRYLRDLTKGTHASGGA